MHILIAPNAFKGSLTSGQAAQCIAAGLRKSKLSCTLNLIPIADGGDGTAHLVSKKLSAKTKYAVVHNPLGKKITDAWDIRLYSTYASTEMQTAFTECTECKGGHLQPDLLIVELLDEMNKAVAPGEPGEVTITTLGVEGMPLLRYKTGDICVYDDTPCACGRNSLRLSPVMGRKKQMLKFKGTTLYPPALFDILNEMENVIDYVAEVSSDEMGMDDVKIYIAPNDFSEECNRKIRADLQARLRVSPHIKYITEEEIKKMQMPEAGRKIIRFIDRRN